MAIWGGVAMVEINERDMEQLRKLMRRDTRPHLRTKATALWNLGRGKTGREVADFLGVSTTSVGNWVRRFRDEGLDGLAIRVGLTQTRWTLSALAQVVPSLKGFSEMGVWKVLNRMGYRYKRGQPYLHSPDPEYEEKKGPWIRPSERPPRTPRE